MRVDIALFFHICGVLTLFVSAAVEIIALTRLRSTTSVAEARVWITLEPPLQFTFPLAGVVLICSGLFMLHENPDFKVAQPWAMTVLVLLVALSILGAVFNGQRMMAIHKGLQDAPNGSMPPDLDARIHDSYLLTSISSMTGAIFGAVLIMTVKPGLRDSIIIAAVSMILGALSAQPVLRRQDTPSFMEGMAVGAAEAE